MMAQPPFSLARRLFASPRQEAQADTGAGGAGESIEDVGWSELLGRQELVGDLLEVAIIVVLTLIGYRVLTTVTRRMEREIDEPDPILKRRREQRLQTMASLIRSVGLAVILVVAGLTILSTFIEIGPLLAAAGIVGLAISFGAQSLVKDVISGAFILMEGQFGVGDVIRVGETAGLVERITLRTTALRDINGIAHIIPNGEIATVSNLTKGWSRALLEIGVAYGEDADRVMAVMREIGLELYDDPEWGALILEEPEVPGIEAFGDSAVVIRIMAKTLPLKQWDVQRELRRRIKRRFDEEGIEIPFPHRTLYWGGGQEPGRDGGGERVERVWPEAGRRGGDEGDGSGAETETEAETETDKSGDRGVGVDVDGAGSER